MLSQDISKILLDVQKPGRYVGGELNSVVKDGGGVDVRYAFCFPDTYEIGMSHLGMKILYSAVNDRKDAWCERVFAPAVDMEAIMREKKIPLWALESGDSVKDFDIIGFTLQYE
ncbi:MAG: B12-binding domain-containing radical SAM protein, partial [Clostridia bacterium]|nr:B12-binding domain-containing radical SAM protein [Clostridia bacterium]